MFVGLMFVSCASLPFFKSSPSINQNDTKQQVSAKVIQQKPSTNINIEVKTYNDSGFAETLKSLNDIYGKPIPEINAFFDDKGNRIIRKKLYYWINSKTVTIVSIVNNKVIFIETTHIPIVEDE